MHRRNSLMIGSTDLPKRVAVYCRVSSAGQEDNSSLATQEASCRSYATEQGWEVVAIYRDVFTGAAVFERPGLTELRTAMRGGAFNVLLVHALDRLSRDQNHLGLVLTEAEHAGVAWDSVTEDIDDSPTGRILRAVISGMAELERLKITERTQRGKRARVAAGKYNVGCRPPYGYHWANPATKERLEPDPSTAPILQRIITGIAAGTSARQMALTLMAEGVPTPSRRSAKWHVSTIRSLLKNPVYAGDADAYRWRVDKIKGKRIQRLRPEEERIRVAGIASPLVTKELLHAAQERLAINKWTATRNNRNPDAALLRGRYIRCGYCGFIMQVQNDARGAYYRCNTTSRDQNGCPCHMISAHIIDRAVWQRVEAVLTQPEIIQAEVARLRRHDPVKADLEAAERRLTEIERQRGNLARRIATIDDDDIAASLLTETARLTTQQKALVMQRDDLEAQRAGWATSQERLNDLESWCRLQARNLDALSYDGRRLALEALGVVARVWSIDHDPRYDITLRLDALPAGISASDLRTEGGVALGVAHVDGYTRRGCARRDGRHGGRL
jgi:site-specific DNA recombinase